MSKPRLNIKKILLTLTWLLAGVGLVVVLIAAIRKSNDANCKGAVVTINGAKKHRFVDAEEVWNLIAGGRPNAFKGRAVTSLDLRGMEAKLRQHAWISEAELFVDQGRTLQIKVQEREPVARIFTSTGNSFYLDSTGRYLPLETGKDPLKLPVFTGMPESINPKRSADSSLLDGVKQVCRVMEAQPFWMAQITQVQIDERRQFAMVPLIGRHLIYFGDGAGMEQKFHRLEIFYRNVLAKTGFDYYRAINVQFDQQVIGIKRESISTSVDKKMVLATPAASPLEVNSTPANAVVPHPVKTAPKAVMKKPKRNNN